jgi:hypothetical protein
VGGREKIREGFSEVIPLVYSLDNWHQNAYIILLRRNRRKVHVKTKKTGLRTKNENFGEFFK